MAKRGTSGLIIQVSISPFVIDDLTNLMGRSRISGNTSAFGDCFYADLLIIIFFYLKDQKVHRRFPLYIVQNSIIVLDLLQSYCSSRLHAVLPQSATTAA